MTKYNPKEIESKWQKLWQENKTFEVKEDPEVESASQPHFRAGEKFYALVEFPYPSGAGLHVGHPRSYTAMDIICRKKRMQGKNVLYPIGFDAFGLPTENFAIKTGRKPADVTKENIATFTRQLKSLGFSFDWSRVVDTTDPDYYKWTQWIFLQLYKHGLAYKHNMPVNWCINCKIGLANEEVVNGKCERCGGEVEKRDKEQWMLAITKYADSLIQGLEEVDYIPQAKTQQQNWIGRSEGARVKFKVKGNGESGMGDESLEVFTTRPDTLFGATYMVVAPEHEIIKNLEEVNEYISKAKLKSDLERTEFQKEKTGVEIKGVKAINPVNNEEIPIYVADYVLASYGTGAIMAVPAHDERDFEFAKKYGIEIRQVVKSNEEVDENEAFTGEGESINSDFLNGLETQDAIQKMIEWLEKKNLGKKEISYKLRDWVFSRQRYWGEPIPLVHCENCAQKKQIALLIHGFEGSADANWFPWLKEELEKQGYEVFAPTMSTSDHPDLDKWLEELMPYMEKLGEDDLIVGHSLGCKAALRLIEKANKKIGYLYFIAPAISKISESTWNQWKDEWEDTDVDTLRTFWEIPANWEKVTDLVYSKNVLFSNDDEYIDPDTFKDLPFGWHTKVTGNFGHFDDAIYSEILDLVLQSKNTGWIPLPEKDLPVVLPEVEKYEPTDTGESPLSAIEDWVNTKCPKCGGDAKRETDTMPNWAGSSWYFLRYCDPKNNNELSSQEKLKYWMPVDWYNGGMEHTVLHLLYSRFWNQFLYDIKSVPFKEPYVKRTSHGMILAKGGEKMSKSKGNVVNPDEMVEEFGADVLRIYIMFMGPFDQAVEWDTNGLVGVRRFLEKVWNMQSKVESQKVESVEIEKLLHKTIKKVGDDIEEMHFNTAVAAMMELSNEMNKQDVLSKEIYEDFIKILSSFAPHMCEELWEILGNKEMLSTSEWPEYDPELCKDETMVLGIQINGKIRDEIEINLDDSEDTIKEAVMKRGKIQNYIKEKEIKKFIVVKGRIISIVV